MKIIITIELDIDPDLLQEAIDQEEVTLADLTSDPKQAFLDSDILREELDEILTEVDFEINLTSVVFDPEVELNEFLS